MPYPYDTDDIVAGFGRFVIGLIAGVFAALAALMTIATYIEGDPMPRVIGGTNTIEIQDGLSGDVHVLTYRTPTNAERAAYTARAFKREGKKIVNRLYEVRVKYGHSVLAGLAPGSIEYNGKPLSSNDQDPGYDPAWKEVLQQHASDILAALAAAVFEGTRVKGADVVVEGPDEDPT